MFNKNQIVELYKNQCLAPSNDLIILYFSVRIFDLKNYIKEQPTKEISQKQKDILIERLEELEILIK